MIENSIKIDMYFIDTKEKISFRSVSYASRVVGIPPYSITRGLDASKKKKFTYQNREVVFRTAKTNI